MERQGKQGIFVLFVVTCAVVVYFAVRFLNENEESRIRKIIYSGVVGLEKKDILRCASLISDNYLDQDNNSKVVLLGIIKNIFSEFIGLKVDIKQLHIKVDKDTAEVSVAFKCYFRKLNEKQIYYDKGKLNIKFEQDSKAWKARSIDYSGADEILFIQSVA